MAASLYRDDREATFLAKYGATELLLLLLLLESYLTTVTLQPRLLFKGPFY